MSFLKHLELIKRLHSLVNRKGTGSPNELASRLEVSRASVFRYLDDLRNLGAPIAFCRYSNSYYYEEPFELEF